MSQDLQESPNADGAGTRELDAIVVGAGFSGLYMLHRLRQLGMSARVFEKGEGVGGTWYWNRYPGARCDSESVHYSFSFDEALEQEWEWTERYPTQPEILRYLNHVADRFDMRRDIQFSTAVEQVHWHEGEHRWFVRTSGGERWSATFFISAVGCLTEVNKPAFKGLDSFEGDWYHTARWPHEGVDFTGKRVGFIGTGSTGIQAIPQIAKQAAHLTVFQRTPNFSLPAHNHTLDDDYKREVKENYRSLRQKARQSAAGFPLPFEPEPSALAYDEEERQRLYEEAWKKGAASLAFRFADVATDIVANETAANFVRQKIRDTVKDPAVAEKLMPNDHPIGTKRICIDTEYYETYNRDNVTLVDVRSDPIEEITPGGIRSAMHTFELDAIVFAIGFDAMTGAILAMDVRGRDGVQLREKWTEGPKTYLGLQSHGFPNLFMITGPGSPSVLSNMPTSIEQHVEWIGDCLEHMRGEGHDTIEPTADAEVNWVHHVNEVANGTLYPQANSWYVGANIPGKVRIFMPYVGGVGNYRKTCDEIVAKGYEGFELSAASPQPVAS